MLAKVIIENGVKKIQALTADTGTGAPVGSYLYLEKKSNPQGYLYCDGSTFDETAYPALYQYLGTNVLPDWRELGAKGAEKNTTLIFDSTETDPSTGQAGTQNHDVFTQGEFKDDQFQDHSHKYLQGNGRKVNISTEEWYCWSGDDTNKRTTDTNGRNGSVTRGKSRAVFIYIKATSGLTENQQENVLNTINENLSYSTEEHPTGKKWIDGKPIYSKVVVFSSSFVLSTTDWTIINNKLSASDLALLQSIKNIISCFINIPVNNTYMIYENLTFAIDGSNIKLQDTKGFTAQANTAMTLEYTKTTD